MDRSQNKKNRNPTIFAQSLDMVAMHELCHYYVGHTATPWQRRLSHGRPEVGRYSSSLDASNGILSWPSSIEVSLPNR